MQNECEFDSKKCDSNRKLNNTKCWCEHKNPTPKHLVCARQVIFRILQQIAAKMVNIWEVLLVIQ